MAVEVIVVHPFEHWHSSSRFFFCFFGGSWLVVGAAGELEDAVAVLLAVGRVGKLILVGSDVIELLNGIAVVADASIIIPDLVCSPAIDAATGWAWVTTKAFEPER